MMLFNSEEGAFIIFIKNRQAQTLHKFYFLFELLK